MEAGAKQVRSRWLSRALAGVALIAIATPGSSARSELESASERAHTPYLPPSLLDGDIVFRRGRDVLSRIALSYDDSSRFSHVGMVVRTSGSIEVIHAIPSEPAVAGGVRIDPLALFIAAESAADAEFYRLDGLPVAKREEIRSFLFAAIGKPFDFQFKYSDDSAFYCSELVVKALLAAGVDLSANLAWVSGFILSEPTIPPDAIIATGAIRPLPKGPG